MSPRSAKDPNFSTKGPVPAGTPRAITKTVGRAVDRLYPDQPHQENAAPHAGEVICEGCHAVFADKHWNYNDAAYETKQRAGVTTSLCPGCKAIADRDYHGELTMVATPPEAGVDERRQRILDVEAQARSRNPSARIAELTVEAGKWHLFTTTPQLAERIGKELKKAFGGELEVDKLPRDAYSRVVWMEGPKHAA